MSRRTLISTDFAPQETWDDARGALGTFLYSATAQRHPREKIKDFVSESAFAPIHEKYTRPSYPSVALFLAGRAALKFLLTALGLKPGTGVAIVGFTCEAVTLPILSSNLVPVYIDITKDDFSMSIDDLNRKYTSNIQILILQHSFGIIPKHRDAILAFCKNHDIWVIEDLAHGFIPETISRPQTNKWCALFSFGRSKLISSVFGAGVATLDPALAQKLMAQEKNLTEVSRSFDARCLWYKVFAPAIRSSYGLMGLGQMLHAICSRMSLFPHELSSLEKKSEYDSSYEYAYPEILAQTLLVQIKRLKEHIQKVRERGEHYRNALDAPTYTTPPLNRFPLILASHEAKLQVLQQGRKNHIYLGDWYSQPIAPREVNLEKMGYVRGSCPTAEDICTRIINLPLSVNIKEAEAVIDLVSRATQ